MDGWTVDETGKNEVRPDIILKNIRGKTGGGILPVGGSGELQAGYKGYGYAMICEIMTSVFGGGVFSMHKKDQGDTSQCFYAMDYGMFGDKREIENRMETLITEIHHAKKEKGQQRIYTAGEKEFEREKEYKKSGIRKVNDQAIALERKGTEVIHLELGRPDFDTPQYIKDAAIHAIQQGNVFYTQNAGILKLREAVAEKLEKQNHILYAPDEIIITAGLAEAVYDTLSVLLEAGDEVLIPDPVWMNYDNISRIFDAVPVPYALREEADFQPDMAELEDKVTDRTKVMILVSPGNPTGSVLNRKSLEKIAAFAKKHDLIVVSDEIYERIIFDDKKYKSIASVPGMKERTITLNGFSKTYSMTGWRLGYLAGPKELVEEIAKVHQVVTTCVASFVQEAGVTALREEKSEVSEMVWDYEMRRDYLVDAVNAIPGISCKKPEGAFYLWVNIRQLGITDEEFSERLLRETHVAVVPGSVFGNQGKGYIRISYASSLAQLKEAVKRINDFITGEKRLQNERE